ncbi:PQQ-dependent sugar dehydrogenase [Dyadobacter luticola]|uniref:C-type cytochrome n=1 Tax=Dyadobacter luticola TaxID=1979387 RepID=A0A5R9L2V6_9BACT|nr:PQQ-dependent sugar dehydrogenase [Dyadobacter luticola]TLV02914.1 c-type cytochrome [Dyadobacter luticola]
MKNNLTFILLLTVAGVSAQSQDGPKIFQTYCAGCHGAQLQGGSAPALIKTDWKYGKGAGAISKNIKYGIAHTDMAAFKTTLDDAQIKAVTDFIVKSQTVAPSAKMPVPETINTKDYVLKVEQVVNSGLHTPWGIEFIDSNHALISERTGAIRFLNDGKLDPEPVTGVPATFTKNATSGYFDIALDPDYKKNGWVYLAYSHTNSSLEDKKSLSMTKLVRAKIKGLAWTDEQTLFEVPDSLKVVGGTRWGGRLFFDKSGFLFFSIGDMNLADDSQNPGKPSGKVFRINADGSIPKDNPFINDPKALPAIYSLGNRNVQGFAPSPVTGEIWMTEHGPMGGDELNILKKGANYGWPKITYGVDYSGEIVSNDTAKVGMEQTVTYWTPSPAVCPAEFVTSSLFPKWKNNLLVGALAFEEIKRLVIEGNRVKSQEIFLKGFGRVREIKTGPDGAIYVLLNDPDLLLRLTPKN